MKKKQMRMIQRRKTKISLICLHLGVPRTHCGFDVVPAGHMRRTSASSCNWRASVSASAAGLGAPMNSDPT